MGAIELTGILLAGGRSRRLGRDKAVERIGSERIIDRVIQTLAGVTTSQTVVVDRLNRIKELNIEKEIRYVVDSYSETGSLGGLFSGLSQSPTPWSFLAACDMPFLSATLIKFMMTKISNHSPDVVIPKFEGRLQTTHALYNKSCLKHIEARLEVGLLKMDGYFSKITVCEITEDEFLNIEGSGDSFFNVNTPDDLETALRMEKYFNGD